MFDSDLVSNFSLLYKDDCKVINIIQHIKPNSQSSFKDAIKQILDFITSVDNKAILSTVAQKYNKESKLEWILSQAVRKIDTYTSRMTDDECERSRKVLLDLIISIIEFHVNNG